MAEVTRSASRSIYVASSPANRMTVWHLRDFVRALDEAGIPDNLRVEYQRSDSMHLTGLSVRHTVDLDTEAAQTVAEAPPDAP